MRLCSARYEKFRKTISALGVLGGGERRGDVLPTAAAIREMIATSPFKGACGDEVMLVLNNALDDHRICADPPTCELCATPAAALLVSLDEVCKAGIMYLSGRLYHPIWDSGFLNETAQRQSGGSVLHPSVRRAFQTL